MSQTNLDLKGSQQHQKGLMTDNELYLIIYFYIFSHQKSWQGQQPFAQV